MFNYGFVDSEAGRVSTDLGEVESVTNKRVQRLRGQFVALLGIAFAILVNGHPASHEATLRKSVDEYVLAWKKRDYIGVWAKMSPRLQLGNENQPKVFEAYVRRSGLNITRIDVKSIRLDRLSERVKAQVHYQSADGTALGAELQELSWILSSGKWLYDGSRSLE